jgi:hypothetical protein
MTRTSQWIRKPPSPVQANAAPSPQSAEVQRAQAPSRPRIALSEDEPFDGGRTFWVGRWCGGRKNPPAFGAFAIAEVFHWLVSQT